MLDHQTRSDFAALQHLLCDDGQRPSDLSPPATLKAFDLLCLDGHDLRWFDY
jgi:ATP-dependent DNA ligase